MLPALPAAAISNPLTALKCFRLRYRDKVLLFTKEKRK